MTKPVITVQDINKLLRQCEQGVTTVDHGNDLIAQCYNVILELMPKAQPTGKWTMTRLWRSWMASTAEYMATNGAIMPTVMDRQGKYKKTRPFNASDAHELFTRTWLGTDDQGNRYSWAKEAKPGEVVADKGQRFYAMQQHQAWMVERAIQHINPRESEFAQLLAHTDGMDR